MQTPLPITLPTVFVLALSTPLTHDILHTQQVDFEAQGEANGQGDYLFRTTASDNDCR